MSSESPTHVPPPHAPPHQDPPAEASATPGPTNKLAGQTSPYLLQHAHNPVHWHAWGEEAFEKARGEQKPIFLSIGYSTCYWCHVMERQDFENAAIAALMNEHFVNIKVDWEERPDIDDVYMTATQIFTRRGGWPNNLFLTPPGAKGADDPGLKPYFAGTYFPPEAKMGMPGFGQVLEAMSKAWREQRGEVIQQGEKIAELVRDALEQRREPGKVGAAAVQNAANQLLHNYDHQNGGFGGAPKFPTPSYLAFLLAVYRNDPDPALGRAIRHTLDRMARGGVYDQVGGGFHRYSVDDKWLVPHFEKMLYDNGQLVELYARACEAFAPGGGSAKEQHEEHADDDGRGADRPVGSQAARVLRETCDYVLREMIDPTGALWSAQDAEVHGREGANYLWTTEQVEQAVDDPDLGPLAVRMYGLDQGTNFQDPHDPEAAPANVLYLPRPLSDLARETGTSLAALHERRGRLNAALLEARAKRDAPRTDDKVLTGWNGMMIAGLAEAGRVLDEPKYIEAAARAAEAVLEHMTHGEDGLYRTMRRGEAKIPGFLNDYACLAHGLIALHRAHPQAPSAAGRGGADRWLALAQRCTQAAVERFAAGEGGYFDMPADHKRLFVRTRAMYDGAIPSGNSRMIHNLLDLHELTGDKTYLHRAVRDLHSFAEPLTRSGPNMAHLAEALLRAIQRAPERFEAGPASEAQQEAREQGAVTVNVQPRAVDLAQGGAEVMVTLDIAEACHINGHETAEDLAATTITLGEASPGLSLDVSYPRPRRETFAFADQPLAVYTGQLNVPVTIRRTGEAPAAAADHVTLVVQYQACTDTACLAPRRVEVAVKLNKNP